MNSLTFTWVKWLTLLGTSLQAGSGGGGVTLTGLQKKQVVQYTTEVLYKSFVLLFYFV